MQLIQLMKSRKFLLNILLAIVLIFGIVWGILRWLDYYTLHGQTVTVPDLTGLKLDEIDRLLEDKKLRFLVVDSIFDSNRPRGTVIEQDPEPESLVKENRSIYLTMNAYHPPRVPMPSLVDKSLRSALIILENMGLKAGKYTYQPDMCNNCVLKQQVDGKDIEEGEMVPKGAKIDLILGRTSNEQIRVPLLIDLGLDSAMGLLRSHYLNLGGEVYDETVTNLEDSANARVFMQDPPFEDHALLPLGSSVNLWLTLDRDKIDTNVRSNYVPNVTIHNTTNNDSVPSNE